MVKGVRVPARTTQPIALAEFERLEDYQTAVGGMLEAVDIPRLGLTLYLNEEGVLRQMEFNPRLTYLWWYHVVESRQQAMLVGDAVIVGIPGENGASTDIPEELAMLFTSPGSFRIDVQWPGSERWIDHGMRYNDYFEALVWAMIVNERFSPREVKVVGQIASGEVPAGPTSD